MAIGISLDMGHWKLDIAPSRGLASWRFMKDNLKIILFPLVIIGILFGSAGRWDLPFFWALMAIFMIQIVVGLWVMDPDLRKERVRPAPGGIHRHLRWMVMPFFIAHWVIAGLDVGRFHWSDTVPPAVQSGGLVGMAATMGLAAWAVSVNRFFSPVVRIQEERGHHLVTTGPYQFIRHPGYFAGMSMGRCSSLVLGS